MGRRKRPFRIEVVRPQYVFLKVIPNKSIRNTDTHLVAKTIANLYRGLWTRLNFEDHKILKIFKKELFLGTRATYTTTGKIAYFVYMEKKKIEFYFIIPAPYLDIIKERLGMVWRGVTLKEVEEIPTFDATAIKYQMIYEKEDPLSLKTDRKSNDLLNASLNVVDLMEEGDRVGILYNFIPTAQGSFRHAHSATIEKVKNGQPVERKKTGAKYIMKLGLSLMDTLVKDISEALSSKKKEVDRDTVLSDLLDRFNGGKKYEDWTEKKAQGPVVDTQILVMSHGPDRLRQRNHAVSVAQSFDVLTGDNRLVKKIHKGEINVQKTRIQKTGINRMGDQEIQSLISAPGRELIERYPFMDKVDALETIVPEDLHMGTMCIGTATLQGKSQKVFLSNHGDNNKLMLLLIGPSRAGKSNLISHLCVDAIESGECVILLDFIKTCDLSRDVAKCFPEEKVLVIRGNDPKTLQGLGFNEVGRVDDPFEQYENAKTQTACTEAMINAINPGDVGRLTAKMSRYLDAACLVVYINHGPMKDVFGVLQDHKLRHDYMGKIPKNLLEYMDEYMRDLEELDELDKKTGKIIGTKIQPGIMDRLSKLKKNTYMELMLKKDIENNINLIDEMQKNQMIVIQMPEKMFPTDGDKDIYVTYWMSKIWLSLQIRASIYEDREHEMKMVNLVVDEIYQVNNAEIHMTSKLSQIAKFHCKPIISCHYINQLKHMREELRSANPSYMLLSGCDKKNFTELKDELYPYTYEDDLKNLKPFHSLNYIKYEEGHVAFITKLPGKIDKRIREKNKKPEARKGVVVTITDGKASKDKIEGVGKIEV